MKTFFKLSRNVFVSHAQLPKNRNLGKPLAQKSLAAESANVLVGQGKGCGKGCVCNITLSVTPDDIVHKAEFVSIKLLLGEGQIPLRTLNGCLLVSQCNCMVVNGLASILTTQVMGSSLEQLRNRMLYVPRAPDVAIKSLLRNLQLDNSYRSCIQLVESAFVAAIENRYLVPERNASEFVGNEYAQESEDISDGEVDFREQYTYL